MTLSLWPGVLEEAKFFGIETRQISTVVDISKAQASTLKELTDQVSKLEKLMKQQLKINIMSLQLKERRVRAEEKRVEMDCQKGKSGIGSDQFKLHHFQRTSQSTQDSFEAELRKISNECSMGYESESHVGS